ncbi:MAG TPA: SAM-dependent methyltransferase [Actinophytocola sp.]|uniref:SAM-dependent methyltransferase n=1 Tax=Actinophytocola sp. TaxID=1872138 RepID=UPI002DDD9CA3|nr:SAM-dependent methyltransferase [Actinophytocola sp.]HEV2781442.1 SAM-dependent methyltransferase [Actinophytocola sp.]
MSRTAIGVAALRAMESRRPDALFVDPYAEAFVAEAMTSIAEDPAVAAEQLDQAMRLFGLHIVLRTRYYDDYLLRAAAAGCRQVVLLAAGLDTRAFRLDWPDGVRLFELDLPDLLDYKERVLAAQRAVARCARTVLRVDLRDDWPARLVEAGLRQGEPTAWLIEGLLVYLSADEAARLLSAVGDLSAPGSRVACEHRDTASNPLLARARATPEMDEVTSLWKGGLGEDLVPWLGRHGWRVEAVDGAELAEAYGRAGAEVDFIGFLTAVRD